MTDAPTPRRDGRNIRATRTRTAIMDACRTLMRQGNFRPCVADVASWAGVSVRSVFQHYTDVESLHRAALDVPTRDDLAALIMRASQLPPAPAADCIAFAAVFGRPISPK